MTTGKGLRRVDVTALHWTQHSRGGLTGASVTSCGLLTTPPNAAQEVIHLLCPEEMVSSWSVCAGLWGWGVCVCWCVLLVCMCWCVVLSLVCVVSVSVSAMVCSMCMYSCVALCVGAVVGLCVLICALLVCVAV